MKRSHSSSRSRSPSYDEQVKRNNDINDSFEVSRAAEEEQKRRQQLIRQLIQHRRRSPTPGPIGGRTKRIKRNIKGRKTMRWFF